MADYKYPWDEFWFVERYLDKLNWELVCENESITPEFLDRYLEKGYKLNWHFVSGNKGMTPEFFEKYSVLLVWNSIGPNPSIIEPLHKYVRWF